MNAQQAEDWARVRQKGRWSYILRRGVLGWGVVCAVIVFVFDSFIRGTWLTPRSFVPSLAVWAVAGVAFGDA
jgi:hypothetical protein